MITRRAFPAVETPTSTQSCDSVANDIAGLDRVCVEELDQIPFSQRIESRIAFIESCLKQRLLRPHEIDDGIYRVRRTFIKGHVASSIFIGLSNATHILSPTFAFADLVLERRDGAVMAILVPPDLAYTLAASRWLRIDSYRRPFILGETLSSAFPNEQTDLNAMKARRDRIIERTGLDLASPASLPHGPLWGECVLSVDPGHVFRSNLQPWSVLDRGRALGDGVFRLDDGALIAILLDPEEAAAAIRSRGERLMLDVHRRKMIL